MGGNNVYKSILVFLALAGIVMAEEIRIIPDQAGSASETLSGYIRDAGTGEELIGVNISVSGTNRGTTSNAYGFFSLTLPRDNYEIVFSYIGYENVKKEYSFERSQEVIIEMRQALLESETIVVSAEAEDQNIRSVEMSVSELNASAIRTMPAVLGEVDVIKSIQLLPGISSLGEGSSGFYVRGGNTDQNLVLLDESPIYNASHLFGFFSVFNSDAIKDVKLYKGGINARYGGRLSSIVDIRQREGNTRTRKLQGGLGLISSRLLWEGPIKKEKGSFLLAARRSYGDIFLPLIDNDNTAFFYDLNLKTNYMFSSKNRLFLSAYLGRDRFEISDTFGQAWGNFAFTLRWNHLFSNRLFSNLSLIYSNYDYFLDILADGSAFRWDAHIRNFKIKNDLSFYVNERNTIDFGVSGIYYRFDPGAVNPLGVSSITPTILDRKYALEPAAYISYDYKVTDDLEVQAGLRYSTFFRLGNQRLFSYLNNRPVIFDPQQGIYREGVITGSQLYDEWGSITRFDGFEPRFSMRYQLGASNSIKGSYNRTRQYIHLVSNTTSPSPLDIWTPSGPYFKPQTADQVALGYFQNFYSNAYETSLELYYKEMDNQLDYVQGAELLLNNTLETEILAGEGRSYGLELYLKKNKGKFKGWLSYTLSRSERRVPGISDGDPGINNGDFYPSNYDKTHDFSLTASYDLNRHWTLASSFVYFTGRPVSYPSSRYEYNNLVISQYEGRNQARLPDYHRLDFSATLHDKLGGDWVFSLYNIYNRMNAASITFGQNENSRIVTEAVKTSIFGIVPSVTYNFTF